jgi:hypothetical protein
MIDVSVIRGAVRVLGRAAERGDVARVMAALVVLSACIAVARRQLKQRAR